MSRFEAPILSKNTIHVWWAMPGELINRMDEFQSSLSADEVARSAQLTFEKDKNKYVLRRGLLRALAGRYLSREAQDLRFEYTRLGKPLLPDTSLQFSVAHSGEFFLYAFAVEIPVGIDLERMRPLPDLADLIHNYFSRREQAEVRRLPAEQQLGAFYRGWTRKEAYLFVFDLLFFLHNGVRTSLSPPARAGVVRQTVVD